MHPMLKYHSQKSELKDSSPFPSLILPASCRAAAPRLWPLRACHLTDDQKKSPSEQEEQNARNTTQRAGGTLEVFSMNVGSFVRSRRRPSSCVWRTARASLPASTCRRCANAPALFALSCLGMHLDCHNVSPSWTDARGTKHRPFPWDHHRRSPHQLAASSSSSTQVGCVCCPGALTPMNSSRSLCARNCADGRRHPGLHPGITARRGTWLPPRNRLPGEQRIWQCGDLEP